jgi:hypothetical protein
VNLKNPIQCLDCSGSLPEVLARLTDEMLREFMAELDRDDYSSFLLLAVRIMDPSNTGLTTNLPEMKGLLERTVLVVNLERMQREGLLKVKMPQSLDPSEPFGLAITPEGKIRLHEIEERLRGKRN